MMKSWPRAFPAISGPCSGSGRARIGTEWRFAVRVPEHGVRSGWSDIRSGRFPGYAGRGAIYGRE